MKMKTRSSINRVNAARVESIKKTNNSNTCNKKSSNNNSPSLKFAKVKVWKAKFN